MPADICKPSLRIKEPTPYSFQIILDVHAAIGENLKICPFVPREKGIPGYEGSVIFLVKAVNLPWSFVCLLMKHSGQHVDQRSQWPGHWAVALTSPLPVWTRSQGEKFFLLLGNSQAPSWRAPASFLHTLCCHCLLSQCCQQFLKQSITPLLSHPCFSWTSPVVTVEHLKTVPFF